MSCFGLQTDTLKRKDIQKRMLPHSWFPFALILVVAGLTGCSIQRTSVPWENQPVLTDGFEIFAQPGIPAERVTEISRLVNGINEELMSSFYTAPPPAPGFLVGLYRLSRAGFVIRPEKIAIVIYSDNSSYSKSYKGTLESLANFQKHDNTVHIPVDASEYVWRHELSHAILNEYKPNSPFWLQEGMAYFVYKNKFAGRISCNKRFTVKIPAIFDPFLPELRALPGIELKESFSNFSDREAGIANALSAYFVFYLWKKGMLVSFLTNYMHSKKATPLYVLTGGNPEKKKQLMNDFHAWLMTDEPFGQIPGC